MNRNRTLSREIEYIYIYIYKNPPKDIDRYDRYIINNKIK